MPPYRTLLALLVVLLGIGVPLLADSKKTCPPVIVDARSGLYFKRGTNKERFPFACFPSVKEARKDGYASSMKSLNASLEGWWRLKVERERTTCADTASSGGAVTIFLQIRELEAALFGETCPGSARYVGGRTGGGATLAARESIKKDPTCDGGESEIDYIVTLAAGAGVRGAQAKYERVKRCLAPEAPNPACSTSWEGRAFKETSHVFPPVPHHINQLGSGCRAALTTCAGCHGG
jgi:hypothetical protein